MRTLLSYLALLALLAPAAQAVQRESEDGNRPEFSAPVRLKGGEDYIATETPGYACPCWHDVDGDGAKDLIVGQFAGGKMKIYRNRGDGQLAAAETRRCAA